VHTIALKRALSRGRVLNSLYGFGKKIRGTSNSASFKRHTSRRRNEMKSRRSFATTSLAGTLLALMIAPGAAPSLSPIGREVASSYRCAVRIYDKAREWGLIARWWIDPEYVTAAGAGQRSLKTEDVCQARPAGAR
jgi:hypothetical protein